MENSKNMEADKAKASTNNFLILKKEDAEDTPNPYDLTKKEQFLVGVGFFVLSTVLAISIGNYLDMKN